MLNHSDQEKIKKILKEFFGKMGFDVDSEIKSQKGETIEINLKTEEPKILIGEKGRTLNELQHILKAIIKRQIKETFFIECNFY